MSVVEWYLPPCARRVVFDDGALELIAGRPGEDVLDLYAGRPPHSSALCLHVTPVAQVGPVLLVSGRDGALRVRYRPVPYAIGLVLLTLSAQSGRRVRCRIPAPAALPRPLTRALGYGDTAAQVRALLRRAEPDPARRPIVH